MVYLLKQDKTRQTFAGPRLNVMPEQASLHYDVYKKRTSLPFTCVYGKERWYWGLSNFLGVSDIKLTNLLRFFKNSIFLGNILRFDPGDWFCPELLKISFSEVTTNDVTKTTDTVNDSKLLIIFWWLGLQISKYLLEYQSLDVQ